MIADQSRLWFLSRSISRTFCVQSESKGSKDAKGSSDTFEEEMFEIIEDYIEEA